MPHTVSAGEAPRPAAATPHVAELWRYPVKSLRGERVGSAALTERGIPGDRLVHVRAPGGRVVTSRTHPRLLGLQGSLGADGEPLIDGVPWDEPAATAAVTAAVGGAVELVRYEGARPVRRAAAVGAHRRRRGRAGRRPPPAAPEHPARRRRRADGAGLGRAHDPDRVGAGGVRAAAAALCHDDVRSGHAGAGSRRAAAHRARVSAAPSRSTRSWSSRAVCGSAILSSWTAEWTPSSSRTPSSSCAAARSTRSTRPAACTSSAMPCAGCSTRASAGAAPAAAAVDLVNGLAAAPSLRWGRGGPRLAAEPAAAAVARNAIELVAGGRLHACANPRCVQYHLATAAATTAHRPARTAPGWRGTRRAPTDGSAARVARRRRDRDPAAPVEAHRDRQRVRIEQRDQVVADPLRERARGRSRPRGRSPGRASATSSRRRAARAGTGSRSWPSRAAR